LNPATNRSTFKDMYNTSCLNGFAFGNIGTSATDAARFFYELFGPEPRILSATSVKAMRTFGPGYVMPYYNTSYGLGVWRTNYLSLYAGQLATGNFPAALAPYLSYDGHAGYPPLSLLDLQKQTAVFHFT
jgi:hypothetical protein